MKALTIAAVLLFAANAFCAIEFSEDQVSASAADTSTPDSTATALGGGTLSAPSTAPAAAIVAQAQSTGADGAIGSRVGMNGGASNGSGMMGSGGGGTTDGAPPATDPDSPSDGGPEINGGPQDGQPKPDGPGADTAGTPDATSIPEPTTVVVWSVLGLLGLVAFRRRKS